MLKKDKRPTDRQKDKLHSLAELLYGTTPENKRTERRNRRKRETRK